MSFNFIRPASGPELTAFCDALDEYSSNQDEESRLRRAEVRYPKNDAISAKSRTRTAGVQLVGEKEVIKRYPRITKLPERLAQIAVRTVYEESPYLHDAIDIAFTSIDPMLLARDSFLLLKASGADSEILQDERHGIMRAIDMFARVADLDAGMPWRTRIPDLTVASVSAGTMTAGSEFGKEMRTFAEYTADRLPVDVRLSATLPE